MMILHRSKIQYPKRLPTSPTEKHTTSDKVVSFPLMTVPENTTIR